MAGLAVLEREIEVDTGKWGRFYFVGSVVTDPTTRLQGYQRELFHAVEEQAEIEKIDGIILWSSQYSFYEKLDFFLGGLQGTWSIQSPNTSSLAAGVGEVQVVERGPKAFKPNYLTAFQAHSCVVKRSEDEMRLLFQIPNMKIASTKNAYALFGKGEDFQKVCHEWSGPAEEVLQCLEALRRLEPGMKILSPGVLHSEDDRRVVAKIEQSGYESRLEYLGLFKLMSNQFKKSDFDPANLKMPFFIWGLDSI